MTWCVTGSIQVCPPPWLRAEWAGEVVEVSDEFLLDIDGCEMLAPASTSAC